MAKFSDCPDGLHLNIEDHKKEENIQEEEEEEDVLDRNAGEPKDVEKTYHKVKRNKRRSRDEASQNDLGEFILQGLLLMCKMVIICTTVIVALYNLSQPNQTHSTLWTSLLSSCLGYALAAGKLKKTKQKKIQQSKRVVLDVQDDKSRSDRVLPYTI